ncbi:MAG TPA: hypothetical protein VJP80_07765 [Candidatus Saccharimonadales bacterium]|nr:hypothetical protein [Candidatus Saccharimonadales bacterium]
METAPLPFQPSPDLMAAQKAYDETLAHGQTITQNGQQDLHHELRTGEHEAYAQAYTNLMEANGALGYDAGDSDEQLNLFSSVAHEAGERAVQEHRQAVQDEATRQRLGLDKMNDEQFRAALNGSMENGPSSDFVWGDKREVINPDLKRATNDASRPEAGSFDESRLTMQNEIDRLSGRMARNGQTPANEAPTPEPKSETHKTDAEESDNHSRDEHATDGADKGEAEEEKVVQTVPEAEEPVAEPAQSEVPEIPVPESDEREDEEPEDWFHDLYKDEPEDEVVPLDTTGYEDDYPTKELELVDLPKRADLDGEEVDFRALADAARKGGRRERKAYRDAIRTYSERTRGFTMPGLRWLNNVPGAVNGLRKPASETGEITKPGFRWMNNLGFRGVSRLANAGADVVGRVGYRPLPEGEYEPGMDPRDDPDMAYLPGSDSRVPIHLLDRSRTPRPDRGRVEPEARSHRETRERPATAPEERESRERLSRTIDLGRTAIGILPTVARALRERHDESVDQRRREQDYRRVRRNAARAARREEREARARARVRDEGAPRSLDELGF